MHEFSFGQTFEVQCAWQLSWLAEKRKVVECLVKRAQGNEPCNVWWRLQHCDDGDVTSGPGDRHMRTTCFSLSCSSS